MSRYEQSNNPLKRSRHETDHLARGDWQAWLHANFPHICTAAFAPRHERLWSVFDALEAGQRPPPHIEIWGRGGAKSSTIELACTRLSRTLWRRFGLYVCSTQDKADEHVQSIADLMATIGIVRAVDRYGRSEGWRRNQLQTSDGFFLAAFGLNTGMRGVKIKEFRPDFIILDDIDELEDTPKTVAKKIRVLTRTVLPAGSTDCAIIGVQNLLHEEGVFARFLDGRADFLLDRVMPPPEPAVLDLEVQKEAQPDGRMLYRITGGKPTWAGQDIPTCERQINAFGLDAFLSESQHELRSLHGYFFDDTAFRYCDLSDLPPLSEFDAFCRAWDLAATEGAGDYTVGVLIGYHKSGVCYVLDVRRHQWESNKVRNLVVQTARQDRAQYGRVKIHLPQDPAQAGKDQASQYRDLLKEFHPTIESVGGSKATRATGWQKCVNGGNAILVRAHWNKEFTEEHRKFREDEEHEFDDQVDAASDAYNELVSKRRIQLIKL